MLVLEGHAPSAWSVQCQGHLVFQCNPNESQRLDWLGRQLAGRNEMDPPLCGSTAMSHNEFTIREPIT
jgi:hypothetical protein